MQNATDVILTGCSGGNNIYWVFFISVIITLPMHTAGGLATFLHADLVSSLLPEDVSYKAMSDGGYE